MSPAIASSFAGAVRAFRQNDMNSAEQKIALALDEQPAKPEVWELAGLIAARQDDIGRAARRMEKAIEFGANAERYTHLAVLLGQLNELDSAAGAFDKALSLEPQRADTLRLAGMLALRSSRWDDAAGYFLRLLAHEPSEPTTVSHAVTALMQAGDESRAEQVASLAWEDSANPLCAVSLARALSRQGHYDRAAAVLEQALAATPAHPEATLALARIQYKANRFDQAVALLENFHSDDPRQQAERGNVLATSLSRLGQFSKARQVIDHAVSLAPAHAEILANRAAIYSHATQAYDLEEGVRAARVALEVAPNWANVWNSLAALRRKQKDSRAAHAAAQRAVRLDPDNLRYRVVLSETQLDLGLYEELLHTHRAYADDPLLARQMGVAELLREHPEAALGHFDRAEAGRSYDQQTIAARAAVLTMAGREDKAREYLGLDRHVVEVELETPTEFSDREAFLSALATDIRNHSRLRWEPAGLVARRGALTEELTADRTPAIIGFEQSLRSAIGTFIRSLPDSSEDPFLRETPTGEYTLNIWATVVEGGGQIDTHFHEDSWLSGAFYVELPELGSDQAKPEGWIEFGRPFASYPQRATPQRLVYRKPAPGKMLFFPSYLFHRTIPHPVGQRISISFDLTPTTWLQQTS